MLFAEVLREAGLNPKKFPKASKIETDFFDRKGRMLNDTSIHFVEELFIQNPTSKNQFISFVTELENSITNTSIPSLQVKIDENAVFITQQARSKVFLRNRHCEEDIS